MKLNTHTLACMRMRVHTPIHTHLYLCIYMKRERERERKRERKREKGERMKERRESEWMKELENSHNKINKYSDSIQKEKWRKVTFNESIFMESIAHVQKPGTFILSFLNNIIDFSLNFIYCSLFSDNEHHFKLTSKIHRSVLYIYLLVQCLQE